MAGDGDDSDGRSRRGRFVVVVVEVVAVNRLRGDDGYGRQKRILT